jgi:hypothetical protein
MTSPRAVRGGYEGFPPARYAKVDADRAGWNGRRGSTDVNDALVVLDAGGGLIGAFQLAVPNYYPRTAKMVADDWNGRAVFAYHNGTFNYDGLAVLDRGKLPEYDPKIEARPGPACSRPYIHRGRDTGRPDEARYQPRQPPNVPPSRARRCSSGAGCHQNPCSA